MSKFQEVLAAIQKNGELIGSLQQAIQAENLEIIEALQIAKNNGVTDAVVEDAIAKLTEQNEKLQQATIAVGQLIPTVPSPTEPDEPVDFEETVETPETPEDINIVDSSVGIDGSVAIDVAIPESTAD